MKRDDETRRDWAPVAPTPCHPHRPFVFAFMDKYSSDPDKKDQPSVAFRVFILHAELANSCLLNYCVVWKVNKLWSWRRRLLKLHWKWIRSPGMAGFSTGRKQHQLSLCAQTVESCRRPVAKIQVLERVWQSHDALGREIPLVGIAPGEWQVSVISFSGFIAQLALALGFCKSHGLEVVFSFLVW